jgi:hypothetical protein
MSITYGHTREPNITKCDAIRQLQESARDTIRSRNCLLLLPSFTHFRTWMPETAGGLGKPFYDETGYSGNGSGRNNEEDVLRELRAFLATLS